MSTSDEIRKLWELRDSGVLSAEEFARAMARAHTSEAGPVDEAAVQREIQRRLENRRRHFENELMQLDRDWEMEREQYLVRTRYSSRHVPTKGEGRLIALLIGGMGLFWIIVHLALNGPDSGWELGILFLLYSAGAGVHHFQKADAYERAHRRYQERRAELLAQFDGNREVIRSRP